jgi:hypothetical protein
MLLPSASSARLRGQVVDEALEHADRRWMKRSISWKVVPEAAEHRQRGA